MMNVLYIGERNILNQAIVHTIDAGCTEANIVWKNIGECTHSILSQSYDICIIDGERLKSMPLVSFNKLLLLKNVPILILAAKEQPLHKFLNFLNNVRGMIKDDSSVEFLWDAINVIRSGGYCHSWDIYSIRNFYNDSRLYDENYCISVGLTPREIEILNMYINGATNKEISIKLSRSEKTISAHKSNILRKIGNKHLPVSLPKMNVAGSGKSSEINVVSIC